jgi:hypothetical protein
MSDRESLAINHSFLPSFLHTFRLSQSSLRVVQEIPLDEERLINRCFSSHEKERERESKKVRGRERERERERGR